MPIGAKIKSALGIGKNQTIRGLAREAGSWLKKATSGSIEKTHKKTATPIHGKMYLFHYDPKTKEKLPYYDRTPLIFVVDKLPDGFYGINLHYLPPHLRMKLLAALITKTNGKGEQARLRISYQILKNASSLRYFKPTFKRYLYSHVKSMFVEIPFEEWRFVSMLPLARWTKASAKTVYSDSRDMV